MGTGARSSAIIRNDLVRNQLVGMSMPQMFYLRRWFAAEFGQVDHITRCLNVGVVVDLHIHSSTNGVSATVLAVQVFSGFEFHWRILVVEQFAHHVQRPGPKVISQHLLTLIQICKNMWLEESGAYRFIREIGGSGGF